MKSMFVWAAVSLLVTLSATSAAACSLAPIVPQHATSADAITVTLHDVQNGYVSGSPSVVGTHVSIRMTASGVRPPDGCHDMVTPIGYLAAGAYTVTWDPTEFPPAAQSMRTSGTVSLASPPIATAPLLITAAVPAVDPRGLLVLAGLLAAAAVAAIR
jgi:hypothetical protein